MKRILLTGMDPLSYGDQAAMKGILQTITQLLPGTALTMFSVLPERSREICENYGVKVIRMPWGVRLQKPRLKTIANLYSGVTALFVLANCILNKSLKPLGINIPVVGGLQKYDFFIELGADIHSNYFGKLAFFYSLFFPLYCITLDKPFILFAETLGPYRSKLDKYLMSFICKRASLITLREASSMDYLKVLKMNNPNIYIAADPAFLFNSQCTAKRLDEILMNEDINQENLPLVGIAPSELIYKYFFPNIKSPKEKRKQYVILMANIMDYIIGKFGATIILISHHARGSEYSDMPICKEIFQAVTNKHKVRLINDIYTVDELKSIIGICQIFVTCKMHVAIAATSMYVPAVTMSFSHKYDTLSSVLEKEKFVVDIRTSSFNQLFSELCLKIDNVWENKEGISQTLKERITEVREKASISVNLVVQLLRAGHG